MKALLKPFGAPPKDIDDSGNNEDDTEGDPEMMSDLEDVEDDIEDEDEDLGMRQMRRAWGSMTGTKKRIHSMH